MFESVNPSKSGLVTHQEFYDAFKTLSYGLSENDIKILIALADENEEGLIEWYNFIEIGIDSIKTFFSRNKTLQRAKAHEREVNKDNILLMYEDEIQWMCQVLNKKYTESESYKEGIMSKDQFRDILLQANMFNPKEINIISR